MAGDLTDSSAENADQSGGVDLAIAVSSLWALVLIWGTVVLLAHDPLSFAGGGVAFPLSLIIMFRIGPHRRAKTMEGRSVMLGDLALFVMAPPLLALSSFLSIRGHAPLGFGWGTGVAAGVAPGFAAGLSILEAGGHDI